MGSVRFRLNLIYCCQRKVALGLEGLACGVHPHISLCVWSMEGCPSLIFLDNDKLLRYSILHLPTFLEKWRPEECAPDPIRNCARFRENILRHQTKANTPIYLYLKGNQEIFCNLGACMVAEVLYTALITLANSPLHVLLLRTPFLS